MKVIIAGSRKCWDLPALELALIEFTIQAPGRITEVVCGKAPGVDRMGECWAIGLGIPVKPFPADWNLHGKKAGPIRNAEMAAYADALIALWNGDTNGSGTYDMIRQMRRLGKFVLIHSIKKK